MKLQNQYHKLFLFFFYSNSKKKKIFFSIENFDERAIDFMYNAKLIEIRLTSNETIRRYDFSKKKVLKKNFFNTFFLEKS